MPKQLIGGICSMPILAGTCLMLSLRPRSASSRRALGTRAALVRVVLGMFPRCRRAEARRWKPVRVSHWHEKFKIFAFALPATTSRKRRSTGSLPGKKISLRFNGDLSREGRAMVCPLRLAQNGTEFIPRFSQRLDDDFPQDLTARPGSEL